MVFISLPKETYVWTHHAHHKMRHYRLTESRIKRIIRFPNRTEEGVIEDGIACMQLSGGKTYSEIWVMYVLSGTVDTRQIKIITCWRYPGKSPSRDPVPLEILREIQRLL
ncbi:MAG: hypothetical protein Q8R40_03225 [bacterium]|nr:hypothetical protein [bacterium]